MKLLAGGNANAYLGRLTHIWSVKVESARKFKVVTLIISNAAFQVSLVPAVVAAIAQLALVIGTALHPLV
jgi:hypothetical protein